MQISKTVAIGGALVIAAAAYAYGWHRGNAGVRQGVGDLHEEQVPKK